MACSKISLGNALLNLHDSLFCGQVFHWQEQGQGYIGALGEDAVYLEIHGTTLRYEGTDAATIKRYVGLDLSLTDILETFPKDDAVLADAVAFTPGLRLCRQPMWECLATFITSSLKQVAHIRQMSLTLRQRFGKPVSIAGQTVYTYPTPEALAKAGEAALRECGLGYRAKGLALAAEAVASKAFSLEAVEQLPDDEACQALCTLYGVGEKIAHCVLLFGYGRLAAFPIDVWVERILRQLYRPKNKRKGWQRGEMKAFAAKHFGPNAGYAQQYLFHYARQQEKVLFTSK